MKPSAVDVIYEKFYLTRSDQMVLAYRKCIYFLDGKEDALEKKE